MLSRKFVIITLKKKIESDEVFEELNKFEVNNLNDIENYNNILRRIKNNPEESNGCDNIQKIINTLDDSINVIKNEDTHSFYHFLMEGNGYDTFECSDAWEYCVTKIDGSLLFRLYMVNHA